MLTSKSELSLFPLGDLLGQIIPFLPGSSQSFFKGSDLRLLLFQLSRSMLSDSVIKSLTIFDEDVSFDLDCFSFFAEPCRFSFQVLFVCLKFFIFVLKFSL